MTRPMKGGKPACPEFKGAWLHTKDRRTSGIVASTPLGCKKSTCEVCGAGVKAQWTKATTEGFKRIFQERKDLRPEGLTFTFRTKRRWETWYNCAARWDLWNRREWLEELGKNCKKGNTRKTNLLAIHNNGQGAGIFVRRYFTPAQWSEYFHRNLKEFWKLWDQHIGVRIYSGWLEMTKQAIPHFHVIMAVPRNWTTNGLTRLASRLWQQVTGDSNQAKCRSVQKKTTEQIVAYIAKYIGKPFEGHKNWHGIRRRWRSINLPIPVVLPIIMLRWHKRNRDFQFNIIKYRKAYARNYYYTKISPRPQPRWIDWKEPQFRAQFEYWHRRREMAHRMISFYVEMDYAGIGQWREHRWFYSRMHKLAQWEDGKELRLA